jgi:hypothetical protein
VLRRLAVLSLVLVLAACDEPDPGGGGLCTREDQRVVPIWQEPALDILVVLDRTPSMSDQAADLQRLAETTHAVLSTIEGGVPDTHLAVITSDLGATGVAGCGAGDGGAFQGGVRCELDDAYLSANSLADGTVRINGAGTLDAAVTCLFDVPASTCPVSQPLGAAVRALDGSVAANAGFRRDYAALVVLVVTDSDDCTLATATALSDVTAQGDLEASIDFACFARGTTCTPADPSTNGAHTQCLSRGDAGISDVIPLVTQLQSFVTDPRNLVITTIAGPADPFVENGARLANTCSAMVGAATAAPRLARISLPERSSITNVCDDWSNSLIWLAELIRVPLGQLCVDDKLDLVPSTPGFQVNCVNRLTNLMGMTVAPLPWCNAPGVDLTRPCIDPFTSDPAACPDGAAVHVSLGDSRLPDGTYIELRCEVLCGD